MPMMASVTTSSVSVNPFWAASALEQHGKAVDRGDDFEFTPTA
jgi:hypothetical protein